MCRNLKFAAAFLVMVILSSPLLAAVICIGGESPAMMYCAAGCPMMASADMAPSQFVAHHPSGACCDASSAKPLPVAAFQVPFTLATASPEASSITPGVVPASVCVRRQQPHTVRFLDSGQSLLCTFLI
jgi:hypothetical protein